MKKPTEKRQTKKRSDWWQAVTLVEGTICNSAGKVPALQGFDPQFLATTGRGCQYLFYGVVRNLGRIDHALEKRCARMPRAGLRAVLRVASFEMISARGEEGRIPRIIDHAVGETKGVFSKGESGMVNAVLRKMEATLQEVLEAKHPLESRGLSVHFNHPEWLIARWLERWGLEATKRFLEWNQREPEYFISLRTGVKGDAFVGLERAGSAGFYCVKGEAGWKEAEGLVEGGGAYIQDPATRLAPEAAGVERGMRVLDLCSAPGGKAWQLSGYGPEEIVCVDRAARGGGERHRQWVENLERLPGRIRRLECDLLQDDLGQVLAASGIPGEFDCVLVDVPCSNTGVIRRRPEVPWRLTPEAFDGYAETQLALLQTASLRVKPGGRLVYSTCSVENEENEEVAAAFGGASADAFEPQEGRVVRPWEAGHDGAGVFSWRRVF